MRRSHSYPEMINKLYTFAENEKHLREKQNLNSIIDRKEKTIELFKEKDFSRAEYFANIGSPSSADIVYRPDWKYVGCAIFAKVIDYFLERGERVKTQNEIIRQKSYAGFYYFIKWFMRALFIMMFTIIGTVVGKELGCVIKDHKSCQTGVLNLLDWSPHIVASILGSVVGLLFGQSFGRFIWDLGLSSIKRWLRRLEKVADKTKLALFMVSFFIYVGNVMVFIGVFILFVDLKQDKKNIVGGVIGGAIGGIIGIICFICAYQSSSCRSGEQTPMVRSNMVNEIPEIIVV